MDDLDLEMEPFDRVQRNDEDISEAMILDDEPEENQPKVSLEFLDLQGRPYDYVYRLAYRLTDMAKKGTVKDSHLESLSLKIAPSALQDQHPSTTLSRMISDTREKIGSENTLGFQNSYKQHYNDFLNKVYQKISNLPPKTQMFLKTVVGHINHDLLR